MYSAQLAESGGDMTTLAKILLAMGAFSKIEVEVPEWACPPSLIEYTPLHEMAQYCHTFFSQAQWRRRGLDVPPRKVVFPQVPPTGQASWLQCMNQSVVTKAICYLMWQLHSAGVTLCALWTIFSPISDTHSNALGDQFPLECPVQPQQRPLFLVWIGYSFSPRIPLLIARGTLPPRNPRISRPFRGQYLSGAPSYTFSTKFSSIRLGFRSKIQLLFIDPKSINELHQPKVHDVPSVIIQVWRESDEKWPNYGNSKMSELIPFSSFERFKVTTAVRNCISVQ